MRIDRPTTCVCVCVRVYCRRVNTIIGCKLVICERAQVYSDKTIPPEAPIYILYNIL